MYNFRLFPGLIGLILSSAAIAQTPVPAPAQAGSILILGATAHLGNGQVVEQCAIAFEQGKISFVADARTIRIDQSKYAQIFDAKGKHVYPGFIGMNTQLGLTEVEAVRATNDQKETGNYNPNARAIIAYNADSEILPTVRANGVLLAQVAPIGDGMAGSSSVVRLDAWNWEEAAIVTDQGQHLYWPPMRSMGGWETGTPEAKANEQYAKQVEMIRQTLTEAKAYHQTTPQPGVSNPRFEALRPLFNGKQTLYIHVDEAKAIRESVLLTTSLGLKIAIVGGNDAWKESTLLRENNIAVVLDRTQRLPSTDDEDVDQPYKSAKMLHDAGITFSFSESGAWRQRNLAFQAGQAVGAGLPYETAIQALTLNSAKLLGISQQYGSLEAGKSATLFVCEGDALDMRTNAVIAAFIDGRSINLDNKQKELYRKYSEKYKRQ
jgi:imidazolonepropionase-like amidohydrolase